MKLEMGESLCYSWLRHVKGCQIVQLNWAPSTKRWGNSQIDELVVLAEDLQKIYNAEGLDVFKKDSKKKNQEPKNMISQMLQQTESDLIGVKVEGDLAVEYYGVDVAFHADGLHYNVSNKSKAVGNAEKVVAKMIRTAFSLYSFMNTKKGNIIFATPSIKGKKTNEKQYIEDKVEQLQKFFDSKGFSYNFQLISNEKFEKEILDEVLACENEVADTSELFLRACQLKALFSK